MPKSTDKSQGTEEQADRPAKHVPNWRDQRPNRYRDDDRELEEHYQDTVPEYPHY